MFGPGIWLTVSWMILSSLGWFSHPTHDLHACTSFPTNNRHEINKRKNHHKASNCTLSKHAAGNTELWDLQRHMTYSKEQKPSVISSKRQNNELQHLVRNSSDRFQFLSDRATVHQPKSKSEWRPESLNRRRVATKESDDFCMQGSSDSVAQTAAAVHLAPPCYLYCFNNNTFKLL